MTVKNAYVQELNGDSGTANFCYAITTPILSQTGVWAVFEFKAGNGPLMLDNVWAGRRGAGNGVFDGGQQQLLFAGSSSVTINAGQAVKSDPIELPLSAGTPAVVRYDVPNVVGQRYPVRPGVSGALLQYKSGAAGAANGASALGAGYSELTAYAAVISKILVADAPGDFAATPDPSPAISLGFLAELEARGLGNQLGSAGRKVDGEPGKRTAFSYQLAADKTVLGYVDLIMITATADCEVILVAANAPPGAEVFNIHCNTNFAPGAPGPNSRVRHWKTTVAPDDIGGRHTSFMLKANQPTPLFAPRGFLGIIYPGGSGLAWIINEPGVGAHVSVEWHEVPR